MPAETDSQSAVTQLLVQHQGALYAYLYACVRNPTDVDDLFQEVSMAVVESFSQLQTEDGFFPWAREIASRRVLAFYRKSKKEQPVSPQVISALSDAAHHVEQRQPLSERQERLQECLERLPRRSRELIARYYNASGESGTRVARQFGQNVNAVYAKIHRIRTILRDCIAQRLQQESGE